MESEFGSLDLLLLAGLAVFLIYRLYGVLGQKGQGRSKKRDSFIVKRIEKLDKELKNVIEKEFSENGKNKISLKRKSSKIQNLAPLFDVIDINKPISVKTGLKHLEKMMPEFSEEDFLKGAKTAFKMIVASYAAGTISKIKSYVSTAIQKSFTTLLKIRNSDGRKLEIHIEKIENTEIHKIEFLKKKVQITVHFMSQQNILLKDKKGKTVEGVADLLEEIKDSWIFERNLESRSNIWTLVKMQ